MSLCRSSSQVWSGMLWCIRRFLKGLTRRDHWCRKGYVYSCNQPRPYLDIWFSTCVLANFGKLLTVITVICRDNDLASLNNDCGPVETWRTVWDELWRARLRLVINAQERLPRKEKVERVEKEVEVCNHCLPRT